MTCHCIASAEATWAHQSLSFSSISWRRSPPANSRRCRSLAHATRRRAGESPEQRRGALAHSTNGNDRARHEPKKGMAVERSGEHGGRWLPRRRPCASLAIAADPARMDRGLMRVRGPCRLRLVWRLTSSRKLDGDGQDGLRSPSV